MKRLLNWLKERFLDKKVNPAQPLADTEAFNKAFNKAINRAIAESIAQQMIIPVCCAIVCSLRRQRDDFEAAKARYELDDIINQARSREFNILAAVRNPLSQLNAQSDQSSCNDAKSPA